MQYYVYKNILPGELKPQQDKTNGGAAQRQNCFGLIETVEKAAQIYMLTCNMPRVNTIKDSEMQQLAEYFGVDYRKDFLNL